MKIQTLNFITDFILAIGLAISFIYTLGVVWRTEKRLDFSYKLTVIAIIFLLTAKLLSLFGPREALFIWLEKILEVLFIIFFLGGIWEMRLLIRKLDGEKKE